MMIPHTVITRLRKLSLERNLPQSDNGVDGHKRIKGIKRHISRSILRRDEHSSCQLLNDRF